MPEKTLAQVVSLTSGEALPTSLPVTYETYRTLRKDPTIALARMLTAAPILTSEWSVEKKENGEDEMVDFVKSQIIPKRQGILQTALFGGMDFGWQAYEKVFKKTEDKKIGLKKLKPLLHDITFIQVEDPSGAYAGLKQVNGPVELFLKVEETLLLSFDVEGSMLYGNSLLENARSAQNEWIETNKGAGRYDRRIAGAHWIVHYPVGESIVKGVTIDNFEIATGILNSLQSSGGVIMPSDVAAFADEMKAENSGWKVELITDGGGKQASFVDRMKYLDATKVRAFGMPERAILEGEFGTKAESEVHADLAIMNMELRHRYIVQELNKHVVDHLLRLNYGKAFEGSIFISAAPITDLTIGYLRTIYNSVLTNQSGFLEEFGSIDMNALRDKLGIPTEIEENIIKPTKDPDADFSLSLTSQMRNERGVFMRNGTGFQKVYGSSYKEYDKAFAESREYADNGNFYDARLTLLAMNRPKEQIVFNAVNRRLHNMLELFLQMER